MEDGLAAVAAVEHVMPHAANRGSGSSWHATIRVRIQILEAVEVGLRQPRAGSCGRSCSYSFGDENVAASITGLGLTSANCITCLPVTALSVVNRNGSCTPATSR